MQRFLLVYLGPAMLNSPYKPRFGMFAAAVLILGYSALVQAGETAEPNLIERACGLIYQGKFEDAGRLIEQSGTDANNMPQALSTLIGITREYEQLNRQRQTNRQVVYKEQLAALEKLKAGDANDVNGPADANAPRDANEANDVTTILAVVAKTCEFADGPQKARLAADPCVQDAIAKAKAKAAELESKGGWIDSYIICYSWLQVIDPNNKTYSDYAEQLIEKAEIAGSFQDSPCETSRERFETVRKRMLLRAVDALNFNYVSRIDYSAMAAKGVRRCKSLAHVVATSVPISESDPNRFSLGKSFEDFRPDANRLTAFSVDMAGLLVELDKSSLPLTKDGFTEVFEKVLAANAERSALPEQLVIAHFAEAAFASLDPYTVLVWPKQVEDFEKSMTNEFSGIGVEIARPQGLLTVGSLLPDTPAYNSGLDAGDIIEQVDGMPTKDMSLACAVKNITGPAGTKVTLTIRRPRDEQARQITITRAKITVPTIRGWQRTDEGKWLYTVDEQHRIGYVRLTNFSEKTASDLEETLTELEKGGIKGLILDLRFNSGGFLESAIEVTDKFISEGLIVTTRPRFGMATYATAQSKGTHPDYPMVVLINAGSASASEIVAGALADQLHKRAILVGERTHGKGLVQGITSYPGDGAQLKYTMAYYHLPSGQKVKSQEEAKKENSNDWGVGPNVEVSLNSDEMRKMFDLQRDNDVLARVGHDNSAAPVKRHGLEETIKADPQLAVGILIVKSKLIEEQAKAAKRKAA